MASEDILFWRRVWLIIVSGGAVVAAIEWMRYQKVLDLIFFALFVLCGLVLVMLPYPTGVRRASRGPRSDERTTDERENGGEGDPS